MGKGFVQPKPKEKFGSLSHSSPMTSIDELTTNLINHFEDIPDPRVPRTRKHLLKDILVIAVLAVIARAEGWEDIENYGISKQQWLEEFLELPHGMPSDDTFRCNGNSTRYCCTNPQEKSRLRLSLEGESSYSVISSQELVQPSQSQEF